MQKEKKTNEVEDNEARAKYVLSLSKLPSLSCLGSIVWTELQDLTQGNVFISDSWLIDGDIN